MRSARWPPLPPSKDEQTAHRFAKDQLKAFIERVEQLEEEKKAIADDIRDVYAEAKGNGFDVKALRVVVRLRKQDIDERKEHEAILETYLHALGMMLRQRYWLQRSPWPDHSRSKERRRFARLCSGHSRLWLEALGAPE